MSAKVMRSHQIAQRVDDLDRAVAAGVEFVAEPHLVHRDDDGGFGPPRGEGLTSAD